MPDPTDIANAYISVARVNHYLVRVANCTREELDAAEQILITLNNAANNQDAVLNLALDIIEQDQKATPYLVDDGEPE